MYEHREAAFGREVAVCLKTDINGVPRRHGKRCKDYIERR